MPPQERFTTYLLLTETERGVLIDILRTYRMDLSDAWKAQGGPKGSVRLIAEHLDTTIKGMWERLLSAAPKEGSKEC